MPTKLHELLMLKKRKLDTLNLQKNVTIFVFVVRFFLNMMTHSCLVQCRPFFSVVLKRGFQFKPAHVFRLSSFTPLLLEENMSTANMHAILSNNADDGNVKPMLPSLGSMLHIRTNAGNNMFQPIRQHCKARLYVRPTIEYNDPNSWATIVQSVVQHFLSMESKFFDESVIGVVVVCRLL